MAPLDYVILVCSPTEKPKVVADLPPVSAAVLRLQELGEMGEKGPGSEGSVARARGSRGLPRYGPSANTGMCSSGLH